MDKKEFVIKAERSEYKGFPMIKLTSGDNEKYPFQFGLQKAKRILSCIKDIEAFVAEEDAKAITKAAAVATAEVKVAVK